MKASVRSPIVTEDMKFITGASLPWQELRGATVLVAGAYGFLPAYLIEALLFLNERDDSFGVKVIGLCRSRQKASRRFGFYRERKDLDFVFQDVCDPLGYAGPVDFIIHGASWASPRFYGSDPVGVMLPNIIGTRNLLDVARQRGCRAVLFMSSAEVYGRANENQIPTPESFCGCVDPAETRSCYAEAKRVGESMCVAWHHQFGVPAKIIRIFHTYGPGMALDDGRVFADFVADVVAGRSIRLRSEGSARRAFCYLADFAVGAFTVLLKGEPAVPYNLGNDEAEISVRELAKLLVRLFPERSPVLERIPEDRSGYIPTRVERACPDTTRLRALGWHPRFGLEEGFRRTVRFYLESAE
ncbi:MAG TPA: NAD-dependent epimerase/dehydratase family protein [Kiritimatiellae bacterium]|nr:NAD-dependent epimerase/dehydratase family protein [Kiritimatiellia bacterium]